MEYGFHGYNKNHILHQGSESTKLQQLSVQLTMKGNWNCEIYRTVSGPHTALQRSIAPPIPASCIFHFRTIAHLTKDFFYCIT